MRANTRGTRAAYTGNVFAKWFAFPKMNVVDVSKTFKTSMVDSSSITCKAFSDMAIISTLSDGANGLGIRLILRDYTTSSS